MKTKTLVIEVNDDELQALEELVINSKMYKSYVSESDQKLGTNLWSKLVKEFNK